VTDEMVSSCPPELATIVDFIRWGASRFNAAGLVFGHGNDSALDDATQLVLHALHLPHDTPPAYGQGKLDANERERVFALLRRRVVERMPVAYLTGEAWFAGLAFKVDENTLIPRSPIAELIVAGFEPWIAGRSIERAADLCTGSGCIGIAMAAHHPDWRVDITDVSEAALTLARFNAEELGVADRVRVVRSDLFEGLQGEKYDLIVSNPPYVSDSDVDALPAEYHHEPALGLRAGHDGLDIVLRMLSEAPQHLTKQGFIIVEVGDSQAPLEALLPRVPFAWVEFAVGQMGVFVLERADLVAHHDAIAAAAQARAR
jgi:ribosomal protein L3 glutamine methyltransferase